MKLPNDSLNRLTIADLPLSEKQKVSTLVQTLVNLGKDHEAALTALADEKAARTAEATRITCSMEESMTTIENKLQEKDRAIEDMDTKHALAMGLLALYQGKLKNSSEMFRYYELTDNENKIKITQLESDIVSLQSLVSTQKSTIESFQNMSVRYNDSLQKVQENHQQALGRVQDDLAAAAAEARRRDKHVAGLQAQIELLRAEVSAKGAALTNVQEQLRRKTNSLLEVTAPAPAPDTPAQRTAAAADQPAASGVATQAKSGVIVEEKMRHVETRWRSAGEIIDVPVRESGPRSINCPGASADDSLVFGVQTSSQSVGPTAAAAHAANPQQPFATMKTYNKEQYIRHMDVQRAAGDAADPYAVMYGSVESSFNMSHMSHISDANSHSNLSFSSAYRVDDNDDSLLDAAIGTNASVDVSQEMDLIASEIPAPVTVSDHTKAAVVTPAEPRSVPSRHLTSTSHVTTSISTEDRRAVAHTAGKSVLRETTRAATGDSAAMTAGGRRTLLDPTPMKPKQRSQQQQQPGLSQVLDQAQSRLESRSAEDQRSSRASRLRASEEAVSARAPTATVMVTVPAPKQSSAEPVVPYSRRRLPPRTSDVSALVQSPQQESHSGSASQDLRRDHNNHVNTSKSQDLTLSADDSRGAVDRSTLSAVTATTTTTASADASQLRLPASKAKKGLAKKRKEPVEVTASIPVPVHTVKGKKNKDYSILVGQQKVKLSKSTGKDATRPTSTSAQSDRHRTFDSPAPTTIAVVQVKETAAAGPSTPPPSAHAMAGASATASGAVRYEGTSPSAAEAVLTQVYSLPQLTSPPPAYTIARPDSVRKKDERAAAHRDTSTSKKGGTKPGASASVSGTKAERKVSGGCIPSTSTQVHSQSQPQSAVQSAIVGMPAREDKPAASSSRVRKVGGSAGGGSSANVISYDDSLFTLLDEMGV